MPIEQIYIFAWIMAIIGFVIGMIVHWIISKPNRMMTEEDGILVLDYTDPDEPYMSLIVSNEEVMKIYNNKRFATLTIERVGLDKKGSHK